LIVDNLQETLGGVRLWILFRLHWQMYVTQAGPLSQSFGVRFAVAAQINDGLYPEPSQLAKVIGGRLAAPINVIIYLPEIFDSHRGISLRRFLPGILGRKSR